MPSDSTEDEIRAEINQRISAGPGWGGREVDETTAIDIAAQVAAERVRVVRTEAQAEIARLKHELAEGDRLYIRACDANRDLTARLNAVEELCDAGYPPPPPDERGAAGWRFAMEHVRRIPCCPEWRRRPMSFGCPLCDSTEYPHSHDLGVVLNARVFCPDGERHTLVKQRYWFRKHDWCTRCEEWVS